MVYNEIKHVLSQFQFQGTYQRAEEIVSGNVNNTYHLFYRAEDGSALEYVLQQINGYAFRRPDIVMRNITLVTEHLRRRLEGEGISPERRILQFIPTTTGAMFFVDEQGRSFRAYRYVDRAFAYDRVENPRHFYEAGCAFGQFQRLLTDFPVEQLEETIPDFHNTPKRFLQFVRAAEEDRAGRAAAVEEEIDFFFDRRKMMGGIVKRIQSGEIPLRVTHNDTKINNVLIDQETERAICVIDLDTVMPGSALYDFGDAIRFGASSADEDEEDLSRIYLDMEKFRMFTQGFLSQVNGFLSPEEIRLLPLGVKVITCELAMRFLTDYIDGDLYFKVRSPEHNLIRARAQMQLLRDMEARDEEMDGIIREILRQS